MARCSPSWIWLWASASICSLLAGCNDPGCIRNNQCAGGAVCVLGSCVMPPQDARTDGVRDARGERRGDLAIDAGAHELGAREAGKAEGTKSDGATSDGNKTDGVKTSDGVKPDGVKPDGSGKKELGGG